MPSRTATTPHVAPTQLVSAIGSRRRVRALAAMGWTRAEIARRIGLSSGEEMKWMRHQSTMSSVTADKVAALADELGMTEGPSALLRKRAAQQRKRRTGGWTMLAWYDVDIDDPAAVPQPDAVPAPLLPLDDRGEPLPDDDYAGFPADPGDGSDDLDRPDAIAVARVLAWDPPKRVKLAKVDRQAAVKILLARGVRVSQIALMAGCSTRLVERDRREISMDGVQPVATVDVSLLSGGHVGPVRRPVAA